jgi:hypothetical protein
MLKDAFWNGAAAFEASLVHHLPGRLRLRSAALKGNAQVCQDVGERLAASAGVRTVTANAQTGSLLLEYDPAVIAPDRIAELLAPHGLVLSPAAAKAQAKPRLLDGLASAIKGWAVDALTEQFALALIGAIA